MPHRTQRLHPLTTCPTSTSWSLSWSPKEAKDIVGPQFKLNLQPTTDTLSSSRRAPRLANKGYSTFSRYLEGIRQRIQHCDSPWYSSSVLLSRSQGQPRGLAKKHGQETKPSLEGVLPSCCKHLYSHLIRSSDDITTDHEGFTSYEFITNEVITHLIKS